MPACAAMLPGELRCIGMKQVDVRVINIQCLEWDYILNTHYNTVYCILLYVHSWTEDPYALWFACGRLTFLACIVIELTPQCDPGL